MTITIMICATIFVSYSVGFLCGMFHEQDKRR